MKKIALTTKEELNIYMSPTRQELLRQLHISKGPMTPKMLADKLQISASGVQHHIKKLMSLGLIELDHIELINGITASFYRPAKVTVQIGLGKSDDLESQRNVLVQESISKVYEGFQKQMKKRMVLDEDEKPENLQKWGDILSGVIHLNEEESNKLMKMILSFLEAHSSPSDAKSPWEYALIAYNAEEIEND